jgi:phosphate starvation-inducible protein PhoH
MQSDINGKSGLSDIAKIFDDDESKKNGIHVFTFDKTDILRSEILKFIISKLEKTK